MARLLAFGSLLACGLALACLAVPTLGHAWEMDGVKRVTLRARDGATIPIGTVTFKPQGDRIGFALDLDLGGFQDHFLSMREFKCLEGPEIQCLIGYPYANPRTVTATDLAWLETALLFFFKAPRDFGAKLSNGLYYPLRAAEGGLVGRPEGIDLNAIASPPADPSSPPFRPGDRSEIEPGRRWIESIEIR